VQNSIDTKSLRSAIDRTPSEAEEKFRKLHGLTLGHTALFLGALDESKKLPFLLRSLSLNAIDDPMFRLLIVGSGPMQPELNEFTSKNSWVQRIPAKFGAEKALILRCADVLVIPGRAGLVVVDSFVAGVPVVTTTDPYHPPEFDYLLNEYNALIVPEHEGSYSEAVFRALQPDVREQLSANCIFSGDGLSIEKMAQRFEIGILELLANKSR
jgi:glycosyltransferase involved in cell wall biosynthesis